MGLLSKAFGFLKKITGISFVLDKLKDWLTPDFDNSIEAIKVMRQGSNNDLPVVYGRQKVGGVIVHKYVTDQSGGAKNDTLNLIVAFAEGEIDGIETVYFDDVPDNDPKFGGVVSKFGFDIPYKWLSINKHLGAENQQADSAAVANIPNWTSSHKMSGLAYCYIQLIVDKNHEVWRGEPQITAIIKGRKVYDPRTSTTAYSTNPAICLRDYLTNPIYGKGLSESRVDDTAFISAADFCDEQVEVTETISEGYYDTQTGEYVNTTPSTTTKNIKRFTCNLILNTGNSVIDNAKSIMGVFRCILPPEYILAPRIEREEEIIETIGANDAVGPIEFNSGVISNRYNSVSVKYNSKLSNYETEEVTWPNKGAEIYQTWLEEDGGRKLEKSFTFDGIDNKAEALQMAEIIAKRSRFNGSVGIELQAIGIKYQVGDVIGIDNDTMGWESKPFRIRDKVLSPTGGVSLSLSEHENSVYPWSGASYDDRVGGTYLGDPSYIPAPQDFEFDADLTFTTFGRLSWKLPLNQQGNEVTNSFIKGYQVNVYQYILNNEGGYILSGGVVFSDFTINKFYDLPIFGLGEFVIEVQSLSTLGFISEPAAYFADFKESIAPYELQTEVQDWEVYVKPLVYVLNDEGEPVGAPISLGIGATFEYDWVASQYLPHEPEPKAQGSTLTITGLVPETEYTIYARSFSATGVSDWISKIVTTTADGSQINPFLDPITQELEDATGKLDDLQEQVDNIEIPDSDFEFEFTYNDLIDQVSDNFWNELTNYERKEEIVTEQQVRKQSFDEVSAEIETANGNVTAVSNRVDEVEVKADGTAIALAITDVKVSNAEDTITAQSIALNQAQIDIEGNATAVAGVGVRVGKTELELSAQASLINQVQVDISGNVQATNALEARVDDTESDITAQAGLLQDVQIDANNNATAITQIDTRVTNAENGITANATFSQQVNAKADGNADAITQLDTRVDNAELDITANASLIQQVEVKADGNATALTGLQTRIDDAEADITAQANLIQDVQLDADNNATAITNISSRVDVNEQFAAAQLVLNADYDAELDEVTARAYFGVNVDGRITGIHVEGSAAESTINFVGDNVLFTRPDNGTPAFYWSNLNDEFLFDGKIIARDSTFTGTVTASTINGGTINGGSITGASVSGINGSFKEVEVANDGFLKVGETSTTESRALLLGSSFDPVYLMWIGKGTRNDTNADFFIKRDGTGFIKGDFFQGEIISTVTASASNINNNLTATSQTYESAGKVAVVNFSAGCSMYKDELNSSQNMTLTAKLYRGNTLIDTISAMANKFYEPPEEGIHNGRTIFTASISDMYIDEGTSVGISSYKIITTYSGVTSPIVTRNTVALTAQEDKLS